jgi:hypothetical protein
MRGSRNRIARIFLAVRDLRFCFEEDDKTKGKHHMTKRPLPPTKPTMRPPPIMYSQMNDRRRAGTLDILNVYCTLPQAAEITQWSETMLRKLVNGGFLEQEYRGIVRVVDVVRCKMNYIEYGKGKEVHQKNFDRVVEYDDDE